jgi:hypothetical protein
MIPQFKSQYVHEDVKNIIIAALFSKVGYDGKIKFRGDANIEINGSRGSGKGNNLQCYFFILDSDYKPKVVEQLIATRTVHVIQPASQSNFVTGLIWEKMTPEEYGVTDSSLDTCEKCIKKLPQKLQNQYTTLTETIANVLENLTYRDTKTSLVKFLHEGCGTAKSVRIKGFDPSECYKDKAPKFDPFNHSYGSETEIKQSQYRAEIKSLEEQMNTITSNEKLKTKVEFRLIEKKAELSGLEARQKHEQQIEKQKNETVQSFIENGEQMGKLGDGLRSLQTLFLDALKDKMEQNQQAFDASYAFLSQKAN